MATISPIGLFESVVTALICEATHTAEVVAAYEAAQAAVAQ